MTLQTAAALVPQEKSYYSTAKENLDTVSELLKAMCQGDLYKTPIPKERRMTEPLRAKCDGFAGARISLAADSPNVIPTATEVKRPKNTSILSNNTPMPGVQSTGTRPFIFGHKEWSIWSGIKFNSPDAVASSGTCPGTTSKSAGHNSDSAAPVTNQASKPSQTDQHRACFICPAVTSSLQTPSSIHPRSYPYAVTDEIFCPLFFCEYKKTDSDEVHTAFHQCQLDCIAGVESLHALGITDFPVYGLVATGSRASIMMAWHSTKNFTEVTTGGNPKVR